jgi:hypothetical protein
LPIEKEKEDTMNTKLNILTAVIISLLLGFQYFVSLNSQQSLPSEEWSRSFESTTDAGNYALMKSVPTESGYATSLLDFDKMDLLTCSEDLQCNQVWSNSELNPYKNTWSDGETSYFIKEDSLILSTSSGEKTIAENVENFSKSDETLMYWHKDQQVVIQRKDHEPIVYTTEYPIYTGSIANEQIFIVTKTANNNEFKVINGKNEFKELFNFPVKSNENIISMSFTYEEDTGGRILLDTEIKSGDTRTKILRNLPFDLSENQTPSFTKLEFFDKETRAELFDIRSPFLFQGENGSSITFSAHMYDKFGDKVNKIFSGNYIDSPIEVSAVTKKGDFFIKPTFLNDQTIAYFRLNGNEKKLMYSSSTDEKITESGTILEGDFKEAFYALISLLFVGMILLLLSFTWLVPGLGIGFGTLAFLQKLHKPYAFVASLYVTVIALVITQLILFATVLHPEKIVLKAPYLTENWQVFLVIILAGIGCILPLLLSRTKVTDDNCNVLILKITGLNLSISFLVLGPYFI